MDFDHRDRLDKKFAISESARYSLRLMREEVTKCDLVCANCHRIRTFKRQDYLALSDAA